MAAVWVYSLGIIIAFGVVGACVIILLGLNLAQLSLEFVVLSESERACMESQN